MKDYSITSEVRDEYIQWLKDNRIPKQELRDVYINDNGEFKTEKKMVWEFKTSQDDWEEFCKETGKDYEGAVNLLAIY